MNRKRRCSKAGCDRQPLYGYDSDRIPRACGGHKADAMVNVTHRRCAEVRGMTKKTESPEGSFAEAR